MTGRRSPVRRALTRLTPLAVILAGLVAVGVGAMPAAPRGGAVAEPPAANENVRRPAAHQQRPLRVREPTVGTADRIRGPHLPSSSPVSLRIPGIEVDVGLGRLRLAADGTLETPQAPEDVGWFTGSAAPGAVGPAVLAGHVTWNGRAAVFFELAQLRPDDRVLVAREDGRTAVFTVTGVQRFSKDRFPTRRVYGPTDHAALRLITCGGRFDADSRRYDDNVVVFARLRTVREGPGRS